jgi:hypothetical protein
MISFNFQKKIIKKKPICLHFWVNLINFFHPNHNFRSLPWKNIEIFYIQKLHYLLKLTQNII